MCKENLYTKMEKLEAQICGCTRKDLKVMPCLSNAQGVDPADAVPHEKVQRGLELLCLHEWKLSSESSTRQAFLERLLL